MVFGYKEVVEYLGDSDLTEEEMIENLKMNTRRYAKRQLTWFRKYGECITWLDNTQGIEKNIEIIIEGD